MLRQTHFPLSDIQVRISQSWCDLCLLSLHLMTLSGVLTVVQHSNYISIPCLSQELHDLTTCLPEHWFLDIFFLQCISFSSADGVFTNELSTDGVFIDGDFTDKLSLFNDETIDPLQNTYSLDPASSDPISENVDGSLTLLLDPSSDLFASSVDPTNNPPLIADCTSINKWRLYISAKKKKKARLRRQTSMSSIRLRIPSPTWLFFFNFRISIKLFPADNENPVPPNGKKVMKWNRSVGDNGHGFLKLFDRYSLLRTSSCTAGNSHYRVYMYSTVFVSFNLKNDVLHYAKRNGGVWTVRDGIDGMFVLFFVFLWFIFTHPSSIHFFYNLFSDLSIQNMKFYLVIRFRCSH